MRFEAPRSATEVSRRLRDIYGVDPAFATGVIHSVAAARGPGGELYALRIGAHAPKSDCDFFLLQAARARADAILTSSANLRAEPELSHDFAGESAQALADYRQRVVGKRQAPHLFILTQSGELPFRHPVWTDACAKHVLAPHHSLPRVKARVPATTAIHPVESLDLPSAILLARSMGHTTLAIETGPRLARAAYGAAPIIDELCLSSWLGPALRQEALAGALPANMCESLALLTPVFELDSWSFARYRRM